MANELIVAWLGRRTREPWRSLCADYRGRIERFLPVRELFVRSKSGREDQVRQRQEGEALLMALPERSWVVALDRRGRTLDSVAFSRYLTGTREDWAGPISFLVGSDLGLAEAVLEKAHLRLSLGPMTLAHELARLVLYEQLYRALTISAGINYHRTPLG